MKFILVRHGETTANVKRLFCGHMDVQLTEKGLAQAEEVAIRLKGRSVDKIFPVICLVHLTRRLSLINITI